MSGGTYSRTVVAWPTVAALALVLAAFLAVWLTAEGDHRGDLLAGVGALGAVLLAALPGMLRRARVLVPVLVVALATQACGAGALRTHATVGTVAAVSIATTAPLVPAACDAALTACHEDRACLERVAADCRTAAAAHDAVRAGVGAYLDAIDVAALADEGEVMAALSAALAAVLARWAEAARALASVGVTLPGLPEAAASLLGAP